MIKCFLIFQNNTKFSNYFENLTPLSYIKILVFKLSSFLAMFICHHIFAIISFLKNKNCSVRIVEVSKNRILLMILHYSKRAEQQIIVNSKQD